MFLTSFEKTTGIWFFFLMLLLMLMFPVGCSKKSHTEVGGETPGTLGGQVVVKPGDRTDLSGKVPEQPPAASGVKQDTESEGAGCRYPLKIETGGKGETNLSELVESHPIFGWAVGFIEGGDTTQIEECSFYLRLAQISSCKDGVVKTGQPAESLHGVFETNLLGSLMYFESDDLGILVNKLPKKTLFQFKSSVLLQDMTGSGGDQPLKMQFIRLLDIGIPADAFGLQIPGLMDPSQPFGDLDAYVAISSSKRDAAPYATHGTFRILPMELSGCHAFPPKAPLPDHFKKENISEKDVSSGSPVPTPAAKSTPSGKTTPTVI